MDKVSPCAGVWLYFREVLNLDGEGCSIGGGGFDISVCVRWFSVKNEEELFALCPIILFVEANRV